MFCCTKTETALKKRFEEAYLRSREPIIQQIERKVCGCDYGGNSWTTRAQADKLIRHLNLDAGSKLLDLGAGTGWPGLYLAKESGCTVSLVDLPEIGLQIAERRAEVEGLTKRVSIKIADAADLPFANASFDAISHSDLLCCLVRKQAVLQQCKKIVRPQGSMAFTVISIAPGLSTTQFERAIENAPEFAKADTDYHSLLKQTGWHVADWSDLTNEYAESCVRQIEADTENQIELEALLGAQETSARMSNWLSKLDAIGDGLFLRELFVCQPMLSASG